MASIKTNAWSLKEIGTDELGQPTVNGKPMLKFRIEKHLPDNKKSKKTLDAEKAEKEKEKLNEGMKQPTDLPDGVQVKIEDMGGGDIVFMFVDEETGEDVRKDMDKMRDKWGWFYGFVYIRPYGKDAKGFDCMGAFEVSSTGASSGWGPMLYDLAMEYATKKGGGLVSDRHGVSEDAYAVWKRYMDQRDDVEKVQA